MKIYLITHASVHKSTKVERAQWALSTEGEKQAEVLVQQPWWDDVNCIILGTGSQIRQTVEPTIAVRNLPTWVEGRFRELHHSNWVGNYTDCVARVFANPTQSVEGWEPAATALDRFLDGITLLRKRFIKENVAVVGYGLTFSLYRAHILGKSHVDMDDWERLTSAAVAQVNPITERLLQDFTPMALTPESTTVQ